MTQRSWGHAAGRCGSSRSRCSGADRGMPGSVVPESPSHSDNSTVVAKNRIYSAQGPLPPMRSTSIETVTAVAERPRFTG